VTEGGLSSFALCDKNEKSRVTLSLGADEAGGLAVQNAAGKVCSSFWVDRSGDGSLALFDEGSPRYTLALGKNRLPLVTFTDQDRRQRFILGLAERGVPLFTMSDAKAHPRVVCVVGADGGGSPAFMMQDEGGKPRAYFAVSGDTAGLNVGDGNGKPHLAVEVKADGTTTYQVIDKDGQKVFSTP
jgi:hypothetical protein